MRIAGWPLSRAGQGSCRKLKTAMKPYKKILLVNLGGIGDLMLSSPAVRSIKQVFSASRVCLLTAQSAGEYARSLGYIDSVFTLDLKGGFFRGLRRLVALRAEHFDCAVNMRTIASAHGRSRIKFLFDFINAGQKAGRDTCGRGDFFDITIPEGEGDERYEMEYDLAMAQLITGVPVRDRRIDFIIDSSAAARAQQLLSKAGINENDTVIGFHLGGKPSHVWPAQYFGETAALIAQKTACTFIATGHAVDRRRTKAIMRNVPLLDLTGQLSLFELGAVIQRCAVFVSPDTAPMHIAAVLNVPLVAIVGPGYLRRFDPRVVSPRTIVLYKKADCAPCNRVSCASLKCIKDIRPAEAAQAVMELLGIRRDR
jgi:heptosyltransferase II